MLIIAEVGEVERFPALAWASLTPTVRSSDAKVRLGGKSSGSTALRWALLEAAQNTALGGAPAEGHVRADRQAPLTTHSQGGARKTPADPCATTACATGRSSGRLARLVVSLTRIAGSNKPRSFRNLDFPCRSPQSLRRWEYASACSASDMGCRRPLSHRFPPDKPHVSWL
jgi:Transposase IS116/IS110/IS902 family